MPSRTLQGFQRIHLKAGEAKPVHFLLQPRQLAWVDEAGNLVEAPGKYTISVGGRQASRAAIASGAVLQQPFSITGNAVTLAP
jgi:beta-glucosidase